MGSQPRSKIGRRKEIAGKDRKKDSTNASRQDHNETRRELYRGNAEYRAGAKKSSLATYRKTHPKQTNVLDRGKLQCKGKVKEIVNIQKEEMLTDTVFTMNDAAKALGKTPLTFKRWVSEGLIPPPIHEDTSYNYKHYTEGELRLVAQYLSQHFRVYEYFHKTHEDTVNRIWQGIESYRK